MTVLLPRDKNASRNIKPAESLSGPKSADVNLNKPRDINQPSILSSDKNINDKAKKVFIKTYGCQMNVYDSERMVDVLSPIGYAPVETPENADLVILNTCHIREKAAEKVYSELGRIRQLKKKVNPEMKVAVAGCVAQAEGSEIKRRAPVVDMVLGPQTYHKLPEMIAKVHRNSGEVLETDFDTLEKFDNLPESRQVKGFSSFLTIQEGCDKFCTFCVVPYTRGAEVSRPVDQVINEARNLASQGVKEITLIGQNVDAYSIWDQTPSNGV